MVSPYFSVIIPTHNRFMLLKRAIDSVLSQTYENFELIIVDDHSTDETSKVVRSFSDNRIQYKLNNRSKGACGARNTGIYSAIGKWVAFLDDDDLWLPEKLMYQHDLIKRSKESVGLICSDFIIEKGDGKKPKFIKNRPKGWIKEKILYGSSIGSLSSTCVKTDVLKMIRGFDESFPACQDKDLWYRVAEISEFESVPKVLVCSFQEKRERISHNHESKLYGHIMLRSKFSEKIDKKNRLKHRFDSPIFIYSMLLKKRRIVLESMPWFLFGLIFDFPHCLKEIRTAILLFYRYRNQILSTPWN